MAQSIEIASTQEPMVVDVLNLINDARMTYGLRHQDYQRYREYCTNRVRRLRQILKLTQSNNKTNNARKALPEKFDDARYLHLYIYETERAWAYAMELKQESANSIDTRSRHHLVKRLKRASQHAEQLYALCQKQKVDNYTVLDVKAYTSSMKGYLFFEQQQWQEALSQFIESRTIYNRFAQNNQPEKEALCYAAMDEIDPNIRFCAYKLQLEQDVEKLVSEHHDSSLDAQLNQVISESRQQQPLTWREKTVQIKHPALAEAIQKAQENNSWTETEKLAKKAVKEDKEATAKVTSSRSAKATEDLQFLFTFVEYHAFGSLIQRNLKLVAQADKPQQAIQLYDDILKNIEYMWELPNVKDDMAFDGELNVLSLYYKGCRCVHVAHAYSNMKKTPESLALYQKAQSYVVQAKQGLSQIRQFAQDALLKVTEQDLSELEQSIQSGSWKSRAAWYLEHGETEQTTETLEDLTSGALINQLETYPSHISPQRLVDFPPSFQPVACKPFYFDLAANFIKYPEQSIDERTEKTSSGFWGIFGGRK
ncbi:uncharacterized protein B0P05DRAFT_508635 [Gilbertella persicaria]|uniref:uncharacterized protein n=1 Tax=Gilbertella persicaria TaxID=101096 RepID=UPI00221EF8DC|nr:uncharacterized protein B0P05DRAFT_508635 [Gilbertella persicaria]KAI8081834.1 hypothetical protein B0P05DRAFT_508635 [Gilbertella persicaria]